MIDTIDYKILGALQTNCRQSVAEIGEVVGISPSATHRRIGILEKNGVIERYAVKRWMGYPARPL